MPDLARRHQPKQGPCRLRGGRGSPFKALIVESVAGGILAPAAVLVLDRQQPVHGLADRGVLVAHAGGSERAQSVPAALNVFQPPTAIPRPLSKLAPAQKSDPGRNRLAVLS